MSREMAISGTHARAMEVLSGVLNLQNQMRAVDIGAGEGAFSARLKEAGLSVSACDFVPGQFKVPGLECRKCDESGVLPFADEAFDLAVAVEVMEHIDGHDRFFNEVARVLKPNGTFMFTTPNILSLKSRLRFLFSGCYYSFELLTPFSKDPIRQHISPFTLNRYEWMLSQHGLSMYHVATDKIQRTSFLLSFLVPFIKLGVLLRFGASDLAGRQNSGVALFGRKLLILAKKTHARTLSKQPDTCGAQAAADSRLL